MTCPDCKFYLPVDVFKGSCKLSKADIRPEDPFCDKGERIPKCKFCGKYTADKEFLGKCMSTAMAYPDMIAAKCADFEWISKN